MVARPSIVTAGRHRRHTSIHPDREVGSPGNFPVSETYAKENSSPDHVIFAYEPISETGFSTRECGNLNSLFVTSMLSYLRHVDSSLLFMFIVGYEDSGIQSTVDELTSGVTSCLPFVRSVLQNQLLQSAKILNEVIHLR